jgi:branched-chain amino acid transport system substrate-binding protein
MRGGSFANGTKIRGNAESFQHRVAGGDEGAFEARAGTSRVQDGGACIMGIGHWAFSLSVVIVTLAVTGEVAFSQAQYSPGATDTDIKIGQTMSYSGPNSAFAVLGKVAEGYMKKVNDEGGINGRKLTLISYDDAFNPAKTVEQTRRLVESDQVLFTYGSLGTALQLAVRKYMNTQKVPQLFVAGASSRWEDYEHFPWTMGWSASYQSEGRVYARFILKERPNARIAILYQNDDYGRDLLAGVKQALGGNVSMIVTEEAFEITEPTMDTHIVKLKASGADVLFDFTPPKFAAQAVRKVAEIGWKPLHILNTVGASIGTSIRPAGFENAQGIISGASIKDASDPRWANDPGIVGYKEFLKAYVVGVNPDDVLGLHAYSYAQTIVQVLRQCGNDLTRENVMRQAANLKDFAPTTTLPGIKLNTSPTDYAPVEDLQMMRVEGERWLPFGDIVSGQ